jgi:Spy/CpxP family protein refolding chaperone
MFTALCGLAPAGLFAQQQGGPPEGGEGRHRPHGLTLQAIEGKITDLSPAQVQQIGTILQASKSRADALRNDTSVNDEQRREQLHQLMKSTHDQVRAALTPAQQQIFDQNFSGKPHRRPPSDEGQPEGPPPGSN